MSSLIGLVIILSLLLAVAGGMLWHSIGWSFWQGASIGIVGGVVYAISAWIKHIAAILMPDSFTTFANDTVSVAPVERGTVISITIPELNSSHQIHGLDVDEWRELAQGVNRSGKYTLRVLQDIFGAGQGSTIYNRITEPLKAAGVLVDSRSGGVDITDHVGRHFFAQLEKGNYEILRIAPPHSPTHSAI